MILLVLLDTCSSLWLDRWSHRSWRAGSNTTRLTLLLGVCSSFVIASRLSKNGAGNAGRKIISLSTSKAKELVCGWCGKNGHSHTGCSERKYCSCIVCKSTDHASPKCPRLKWKSHELKSDGTRKVSTVSASQLLTFRSCLSLAIPHRLTILHNHVSRHLKRSSMML